MKKLNFADMGKTLSRAEMKQIMAGSGQCGNACTTTEDCYDVCCTCEISSGSGTCVSNGQCA